MCRRQFKNFQIALTLSTLLAVALTTTKLSAFQTVFPDDVIAQGSLAAGFDTTGTESFGEDTFRLKENNVRIHFDDTSSSANFPLNDWRIVINDSMDGGDSFFRINDVTNISNPFTVFANSSSNALNVTPVGIGIGTPNPVSVFHILADGSSSSFSSATIRGEVTDAFAAQDRTMLDLRNNGPVVMNLLDTSVVSATPYLIRAASDRLSFQQLGGLRAGMIIFADGAIRYVADGTANVSVLPNGTMNIIGQTGGGNLNVIGPTGGAGNLFVKGNITYNGSLSGPSDRNLKENFQAIDSKQILNKVVNLPISKWNYIDDKKASAHIGPMAQDFHAAFGLGDDDKRIPLMDSSSVALAAIQGLHEVVEAKDKEIAELSDLVSELSQRLERLEAQLNSASQK